METTTHGDVTVVTLSGVLDAATSDQLTEDLTGLVSHGHHKLVLDLSAVEYMSSAALRALLAASQHARRAEGDLRLAEAPDAVLPTLELAGFTRIMTLYDEVAAAIESYA
jgi:anti-anti-sigma factor